MLPLAGTGAEPPALVLDLLLYQVVVDRFRNRCHDYYEHLLVNVNSRDISRHAFLSARKWQNARKKNIRTVTRLPPSSRKDDVAKIGSNARSGSNSLTASTYP